MLNSDVCWTTCEMDVTCDLLCWITMILACMLVGLKFLVISLDYRSYMGSSVRIWSLRWLFLYLCSYNLDDSMTQAFLGGSSLAPLLFLLLIYAKEWRWRVEWDVLPSYGVCAEWGTPPLSYIGAWPGQLGGIFPRSTPHYQPPHWSLLARGGWA
jgi:hypothetical protein